MSDDAGSTVRGRVGRYGRVGAAVGGAAVRLAGQRYLGRPADPERNAADLKAALGGVCGLREEELRAHQRLGAGLVAGMVAQTFVYPLDVVRRRAQTSATVCFGQQPPTQTCGPQDRTTHQRRQRS